MVIKFVFPTNLHCSQTPAFRVSRNESLFSLRIYTALKLMALAADSSTVCFPYEFTLLSNTTKVTFEAFLVCFPYEFTLLSNTFENIAKMTAVCFPYEFTLLSNQVPLHRQSHHVCFPYEFTLLSNINKVRSAEEQFVFPTNLHCSQTSNRPRIIFCKIPVSLHRSYHSSLY